MATTLHTVDIVVREMARSLAFYRLLGLPIEGGQDDRLHVEVAMPGLSLGFTTEAAVRDNLGAWVTPVGQRLTIAFACDAPAEVDRVWEAVAAAGFPGRKAPWDAFWGQRYAFLEDPDGNRVDLFAPLP